MVFQVQLLKLCEKLRDIRIFTKFWQKNSGNTFPKKGLKFIETENIYDKFEHKNCIVMDIRENQHIRGQI